MAHKPFNVKSSKAKEATNIGPVGDDSPECSYESIYDEDLEAQKTEGRKPTAPGTLVPEKKPFTLR
jgi:hypothetical protein